ncbi:MAG: glycosyltransferase family 39 protein [Candidatus Omnitrophica bacterium]|nr:glycosyltransferase family 39 protein [Candidatus Omnitrophota bacterium]
MKSRTKTIVAVVVVFLFAWGIRSVFNILFPAKGALDTPWYTEGAQILLQPGGFMRLVDMGYGYYLGRMTHIGFIAVCQLLFGLPATVPMVQIQAFLSAVTVLILYFSARRFASKESALGAMILAAAHMPFAFWAGYILSETVFLLFVAIWAFFAIRLAQEWKWTNLAGFLGFALVCVFTRPNALGYAVLAAVWVLWVWVRNSIQRGSRAHTWLKLTVVALSLCYFWTVWFTFENINRPEEERWSGFSYIMKDYNSRNENFKEWSKPEWGWLVYTEYRNYVVHDMDDNAEKLRVQLRKAWMYWKPWREWFSLKHNVYNTFYMVLAGGLGVLGLVFLSRKRPAFRDFVLLVFLYHTSIAVVDSPGADGRYRLPCEYLLLLVSAGGLEWLRYFWNSKAKEGTTRRDKGSLQDEAGMRSG